MIAWNSITPNDVPGRGPDLRLFDSSRSEVCTIAVEDGTSMYVCGITPYDATHLGHAATYVAFDLLNRYWRDSGSTVAYVQNVTDVDDPLLERATATGVAWQDLAQDQTDLFREDMEALNVLAPDHYVGAVETIGWLVPVVEGLLHQGVAYQVPGGDGQPDGDVYFSIDDAAGPGAPEARRNPAAWRLGQVSGLDTETMLKLSAERGGDPERPGKRNRLDPLLWRVAREGEPRWDGGTLGAGRPGWHIECAVIAQRLLPKPFTVQGGGRDLTFPHHEMSAAHAWASAGTPLARHYAHAGMVGLEGEKMSKSRGNLVLVSRLRADGEDPAAIRLAILAHHYRVDWSWTAEGLDSARERLQRWRAAVGRVAEGAADAGVENQERTGNQNRTEDQDRVAEQASLSTRTSLSERVRAALANDLDAPAALAAVDDWVQDPANGGESGAEVRTLVDSLLGVRL